MHHPNSSLSNAAPPSAAEARLDNESDDFDFENALIVRADEPDDDAEDGIRLTRAEFEACSPEPLRLVVLMHWRLRERDGRPLTARAIWADLTAMGMYDIDGVTPVALTQVDEAVRFLTSNGLIATVPDGGDL
ncbi:hypothetical protein [Streptomyces alkaliterrae]|uniref:Uncharacterized protein n=1 Tax=Streptomyces alkaliterrae TaxID=2213162 RepID=A0A5P0YKF1_9ACTN|nr:hypothetical protein [Streptomyces alkaliterrae]MBB1258308.1 hypothetical protein [Streptomyces alkaliterrae]MQS00708.1 hypothetical protein [Streptomyces alkaliterrae]